MELESLKDSELNDKVKSLASKERKLTEVVLRHIAEVDKRKLFLRKAYPSLFEYLVREIGYSAGAAQRRIDAARLLQVVPEVSVQIQSGAIHLSQISKMQKVCRQIKKESGHTVQASVKKLLLQQLENKTSEQTDLILAREFQIEVKVDEKRFVQKDESVRVELTFSKDEMALLKRAQDILSNKTGGSLKATVLEAAKRVIKSAESSRAATVAVKLNDTHRSSEHFYEPTANPSRNEPKVLKSVTPRLRKHILHRDQHCQFFDVSSTKVCGATRYLEVDHITPRFASGTNTPQNLRALCKSHNLYRYQQNL